MPYSELKPGRLRLEDESTGTAYLFIQKDDNLLWCDVSENILQVITNVKFGAKADRPTAGKKGLLYFATDTKEFFYDNGSAWVRVVSGETGLYDADRDTYIEVEKSADEDIIRGYVANTEALKISTAGILTFPKQSCCVVYLSADQSISADIWTKVALDTIEIDTQNEFNSTNNRITVSEAGKYLIVSKVRFKPGASNDHVLNSIYKNGAEFFTTVSETAGIKAQDLITAKVVSLNASDYIELYVKDIDNAATIFSGRIATYLSVIKIA